jgi:hypothetical protein
MRSAGKALAFLFLVTTSPLAAAPPDSVNVVFDKAVPIVDDAYIFETVAGDSLGDPPRANLALDLFLRNDEAFTVTIANVELDFDSPNISSITLSTTLQMWCEGEDDMMTGATGLVMPAGARCRLGLTQNPLLAFPVPTQLTIRVSYVGITQKTIVAQRTLSSYQNEASTGSYRFPAKAEDLEAGQYWSGRPALTGDHHRFTSRTDNNQVFAYDLGVIRKDSGGTWRAFKELEAGDFDVDDENDDFLCWEEPVYAMADGIVLDFEGSNADHAPGSIPPGSQANFFLIQHGDEVAWYGHLREDSLNPLFTSINATVKAGDQLALCGNTGSSSAPHLHVQVTRNGDPMPLHFNGVHLVERAAFVSNPPGNMPWIALSGHGLSPSTTAVWPSALRRRGEATDVAIGPEVAIVGPAGNRTMTAVKTSAGNLRVSSWSTDNTGEATLLDTETGGGVSKVSLAVPFGTTDGALAMITSGGALKLSALDLNGNSLDRTVDFTSNNAHDVAAVQANFSKGIVTAIKTQFDNLKVIAWEVDPAGASIDQLGEDVGGAIEEVAVERGGAFPGVIVAVRNASDNLELITFRVSSAGATVAREDEFEDDEADKISIARLGLRSNGDDLVVTASRNAAGDLQLISWAIESDGDIVRLSDIAGGEIGEVSAARGGNRHLLTAVSDADGNYELISWHVDNSGNFVRRSKSEAGAATSIAQEAVKSTSGLTLSVSAMEDGNGDLKLIVHQVQLQD